MATDTMSFDHYPAAGSASPGMCYRCKSPQREKPDGTPELCVTFGLSIEWEGVPWFCESCIAEAARHIGMIYESEARATKADVSRHERRERAMKDAASKELVQARDALVELVDALGLG
jgi:hypothetical protein